MKLTIIIPTFNEQRTIRELVGAVQAVDYPIDYEIIIVDDASVDRTHEQNTMLKLRNEKGKIRIFRNRINRGKGFSIRKGFKRARGQIVVVQDADMEYDPQEIPRLLQPILDGEVDVVYGSRFLANGWPKDMALPNWVANRFLTTLTNILFGLKLTDMETCYKVMKADLVKDLDLQANRFDFEPEITSVLAKRNVQIKELPISYKGRTAKMGKKIKARDFFIAIWALLRFRLSK